jgi:hypothetical protein
MKQIWQSLIWLVTTSVTILTSIVLFHTFFDYSQLTVIQQEARHTSIVAGNPDPEGEIQGIESILELEDGRAEIVANFLAKYDSPLKPHDYYGHLLVEIADRYELDFRFLPAIMMEESNLCKNIPEGTYNCLGFGIHSGGTLGFENYEAGFERAARELRANYVEQGRIQVSEIARKYTASVEKWTSSVNQWMTEMKYDDRQKGIEKKDDASVLEYVKIE